MGRRSLIGSLVDYYKSLAWRGLPYPLNLHGASPGLHVQGQDHPVYHFARAVVTAGFPKDLIRVKALHSLLLPVLFLFSFC